MTLPNQLPVVVNYKLSIYLQNQFSICGCAESLTSMRGGREGLIRGADAIMGPRYPL